MTVVYTAENIFNDRKDEKTAFIGALMTSKC
jgi:hypothetical protein